jgi:hypothetical protein
LIDDFVNQQTLITDHFKAESRPAIKKLFSAQGWRQKDTGMSAVYFKTQQLYVDISLCIRDIDGSRGCAAEEQEKNK